MTTHSRDESLDYLIALARVGFEEDLHRLMGSMKRTDLAKAAGVSAAFVSKVLNGSTNYTLKTMAKLGGAVGAVLQVRLIDEYNEVVRIVSPETAAGLDDAGLTTAGATLGHDAAPAKAVGDVLPGPWSFGAASEDDDVQITDEKSTAQTLRAVLGT